MSIFGNIMDKIFHHGVTTPAPTAPAQAPPGASPAAAPAQDATAAPNTPTPQSVDVGAVLAETASAKNGGGNYQSSIVDLLKLLDLDPSLSARMALANELGVHVGEEGSAGENIALHKAVMDKLVENGGVVPDSLRH